MRFLIFNLAVGAAIFYLLTGDPGIAARQAGLPDVAVSTIDDVSRKAKQAVSDIVPEKPTQTSPQTVSAPASVPPAPEVQEQPSDGADKKTQATGKAKAPDIETATYVPNRPIHRAPPPKANPSEEAQEGGIASKNAALSKRRAEVLREGKVDRKFTVADGSEMMSPRERYRELSQLVDDMELVYFNSLGN